MTFFTSLGKLFYNMNKLWCVIVFYLLLICACVFAQNSAVRDLPDIYIPNTTFNVTINITIKPETPTTGIIITESLPQGWSVVNSNPSWSKYIPDTNSYKWLYFSQFPFSGNLTITYTVRVPSGASGSYSFSGTINDQYSTRNILGDTNISQYSRIDPPVFSIEPQTFYNFFPDIEISCSTQGATIYFTTDGTDPGHGSTVYSGPIHIIKTTTIKAIAYKDGFQTSQITSGTFIIQIQKADINRDRTVDISDVILCLRMAIGLDITSDGQQYISPYNDWLNTIANVNDDEIVDISDVILSLRIAIGLP